MDGTPKLNAFFMALAQFMKTVQGLRLDEAQKSQLNLMMHNLINAVEPLLIEVGVRKDVASNISDLLAVTDEMIRERNLMIELAQKSEARARQAEDFDEDTGFLKGVAFRREFCRRLRTRRSEECVWVLAYIDLRKFSWWNNTFKAHEVGTAALQVLADSLKSHVRTHQTEIGRLHKGGDEFAIFSILQVTEGDGPMSAAQNLIRRIVHTLDSEVPWELKITTLLRSRKQQELLLGKPNIQPVRIDIGAVVWEIPHKFGREDVEPVVGKLISAADREMYVAKEAARTVGDSFSQSSYRIISLVWSDKAERFHRMRDTSRGMVTNLPAKTRKP